jgi:GT2 family glycosyltransferase
VLGGPAADCAVVGFPVYSCEEPSRLEALYIQNKFSRGPVVVDQLPDTGEPLIRNVLAHGAAMLITPSAPVKLIPEEYFLYQEDSDYCRQIYQCNGTVAIQLDNPVYALGRSRSIGWHSPTQVYYTRRNKLHYCKKYNSRLEYSIVLTRMLWSTVNGVLRHSCHGRWLMAKAYILAFLHHLQGKKGRTWAQF